MVRRNAVMGTNKRRRHRAWPESLKREIVEATLLPGASVSRVAWLWCAIRVMGAERSLDALSGDALRQRHTEPGHPVEHRAADPGFGLLGRQCPGAQAATDDSFVAEHGGLPKRAPAVADRLLPAQAPLVPDRLDVLVPLTGRGARGRARHRG